MHSTLIQHLPLSSTSPLLRFWTLALLGSLLFALSAQIVIPFYPVPVTAQTLVIMGFGLAAGWRLSLATIGLYLLEGALGFPVFSKFGGGLVHLFGPSGGYLFGFVAAIAWCGWCAERGYDRSWKWLCIAMLGAELIVFACGVPWLAYVLGFSLTKALQLGMTPFVLPELIKIAILCGIFPLIWLRLGK